MVLNEKVYLGKTKNECEVYVDMQSSHASTHFNHHPKLFNLVKKAIAELEVIGNKYRVDIDMKEEVGTSDLVDTDDGDEIIYAMRQLRKRYSRFVKGKKPLPTSWLTLDLRRIQDNEYFLYTAFVGRLTPSFPGGDYLPEQSKEFWSKHALVFENQDIVYGSETNKCPW